MCQRYQSSHPERACTGRKQRQTASFLVQIVLDQWLLAIDLAAQGGGLTWHVSVGHGDRGGLRAW
eukprot:3273450-Rhodomonas_salina.2